jgi:hypothetical protein
MRPSPGEPPASGTGPSGGPAGNDGATGRDSDGSWLSRDGQMRADLVADAVAWLNAVQHDADPRPPTGRPPSEHDGLHDRHASHASAGVPAVDEPHGSRGGHDGGGPHQSNRIAEIHDGLELRPGPASQWIPQIHELRQRPESDEGHDAHPTHETDARHDVHEIPETYEIAGSRETYEVPGARDPDDRGGTAYTSYPDRDEDETWHDLREEWRERLAERRRASTTRSGQRTAGSRRVPVGVALGLGIVLVAAVGTGAVTLWTRVADARSAAGDAGSDARSPQHAPADPSPAGGAGGPGHVLVAGDSLTATATYFHGAGEAAPDDLEFMAWQGWTAAEAQPAVATKVAGARADTLVLALGTNDSAYTMGRDGWSAADVDRFRQLLATPDEAACVVVVLPGYGPGIDPRHAVEMDRARADLQRLADERRQRRTGNPDHGATVVVDWHAEVTARPHLLGPDGIHLAEDPVSGFPSTEAATTRTRMYWDGVAACSR